MSDILKMNYDDFYKFLVSAGVIATLVFSMVSAYFFIYYGNTGYGLFFGGFWLGLGGLAVASIVFGIIKWYSNQKILDEKLRLDVDILKLERDVRKLEFQKLSHELDPKIPITFRGRKFPRIAKYLPETQK